MTPPPTQWDRHFLRKLTSDEGEPKDDGRRQCGEEYSQPSAVAPEETERFGTPRSPEQVAWSFEEQWLSDHLQAEKHCHRVCAQPSFGT